MFTVGETQVKMFFFCWETLSEFLFLLLRICWDLSETLQRPCWDYTGTFWNSTETLLFFWDSTETLLRLYWDSTETLQRLYRDSTETLQRLNRDSTETVLRLPILRLHKYSSETPHTQLKLYWDSTGNPQRLCRDSTETTETILRLYSAFSLAFPFPVVNSKMISMIIVDFLNFAAEILLYEFCVKIVKS